MMVGMVLGVVKMVVEAAEGGPGVEGRAEEEPDAAVSNVGGGGLNEWSAGGCLPPHTQGNRRLPENTVNPGGRYTQEGCISENTVNPGMLCPQRLSLFSDKIAKTISILINHQ